MTCLAACAKPADGVPWQEATGATSKGCGANMRVAPVAQFQAALTHGHPTGLAASELTAFAVVWLRQGMAPADLPAALRGRCASRRETYHEHWLGDLWQRPGETDPAGFIARGWEALSRQRRGRALSVVLQKQA